MHIYKAKRGEVIYYIYVSISIAIKGPIIRSAVTRQNESDSLPTRSAWRGKCDCLPGRDGRDGVQGRDGRDGMQGVEGPSGAPGAVGPPGPSGKDGGGLTYIRWGRRSCPSTSGTTLVYEGLTAGSGHQHTGGGANYICMTKEPLYQPGTSTLDQNLSPIFGTEYEISIGQALNRDRTHDHNVPCAVCEVNNRSKQLMIPGTYICPNGWTREYYGWLMAGYYGHKGRTMFTCVDNYPDLVDGTSANTNEALMYHAEADCSTAGLPCAPYDGRKELSCVVCTK